MWSSKINLIKRPVALAGFRKDICTKSNSSNRLVKSNWLPMHPKLHKGSDKKSLEPWCMLYPNFFNLDLRDGASAKPRGKDTSKFVKPSWVTRVLTLLDLHSQKLSTGICWATEKKKLTWNNAIGIKGAKKVALARWKLYSVWSYGWGVTDLPVMDVDKFVPTGTSEIMIKCNQLKCRSFQEWG